MVGPVLPCPKAAAVAADVAAGPCEIGHHRGRRPINRYRPGKVGCVGRADGQSGESCPCKQKLFHSILHFGRTRYSKSPAALPHSYPDGVGYVCCACVTLISFLVWMRTAPRSSDGDSRTYIVGPRRPI